MVSFKLDASVLSSFDAYLAKLEYISMMMCHLTAEFNYGGCIANETKLQGIKSSFWNFGM